MKTPKHSQSTATGSIIRQPAGIEPYDLELEVQPHITVDDELHNRLMDALLRALCGTATVSVDFESRHDAPVIDVCFDDLSSIEFDLDSTLQGMEFYSREQTAVVAEILERHAARLRAQTEFDADYDAELDAENESTGK